MAFKVIGLVGAALMCGTLAINEVGQLDGLNVGTADGKSMQEVFFRSEAVHTQSMTSILTGMSPTKAMEILQKTSLATPALMQAADLAFGKQNSFRKQPKGYSGIDGARKLL